MSALVRRLKYLFRRKEFEREIEEEMRYHLTMKAESSGEQNATKQFGNIALLKEDSRAAWGFVWVDQILMDVRYALRGMRLNPLFTAMAVLSLALGIGANTAIYSFMHAILLRSLPVPHPEQLAAFTWRTPKRGASVVHGLNGTMYRYGKSGSESPNFPFAAWEEFRADHSILSSLFAYVPAYDWNVVARNQAEVTRGMFVSGNFYSGLGVTSALGRVLTDEDDRAGAAHVAVLSYGYWHSRFLADPGALGQTILVNRIPFTIVGISAAGFFGVDSSIDPAVFLPLHSYALFARDPGREERSRFLDRNFYWLEMMGRLRPDVSIEQAQAVFGGMFQRFAASTAATAREKVSLPELHVEQSSGGGDSLRRQFEKPIYVLMTMVGLILLIACANLANLLMARASARRREIATRLSLGAGRARVVRQFLTESVLLSLFGGIAGIGVALWGVRSIAWQLTDGREGVILRADLDWPVLGFTIVLAFFCGMIFGLAPALQATRGDVAPSLKESRIGDKRVRRRPGVSHILITAQIALSLLLAVAAALFVRTLANLHSVALGFNPDHLLIFNVNARQAGYADEKLARFYSSLCENFGGIRGVRSASLSSFPLVAHYSDDESFTIDGQSGKKLRSWFVATDASFLETMQIPMLAGRSLNARDISNPRAVVVSEVFAKKFFPSGNPLGQRIRIDGTDQDLEIVGIAKTALYNNLKEETPPQMYLPFTFNVKRLGGVWFELRTAGDPLKLAAAVREIVHHFAPSVPVTNIKTQTAQIDESISQERTFANLCTCFALLAVIIACIGLYGTTAYAVARRTSEIGVRMALGAGRAGIVWMMLRQVLVLCGIGLAIGLGIAWESSTAVASFLYGVKPHDLTAIAVAAGVLLASALLAAYGPARRAARIDPMAALRNE